MIQTPKRPHSVSLQSLHAAHGYTLSTHDPIQRLKDLLKNPNDDYWFVFPPVWTAADEKEEDPEEPPALVCFYCSEPNDDNCRCREAMDAYGQVECLSCFCDYKRQFRSPMGKFWSEPCGCCLPAYRADYVAHRAAVDSCKARLEDLRSQAEELAPAFLALLPAEQAALLEECGPCNIRVKEVLEEAMTRRPP